MSIFSRRLNKTPLGIYIHVPFCRSKCNYCDFYSMPCKDDALMDSYLDAVCAHIKEAGALAPGYRVDTIYFGGGTPSYFGGDAIAIIMTAIRRNFDVATDAEITFECNPDSVTDKLLHRMRAEGFNRVSMGVQDDHDDMLKKLGRPHTYAQSVAAFQRIRKAGFRNVSLDLMYGLPGQTLQDWRDTLENVLKMNPEHFSCYGLKLEEGTKLYEIKDVINIPDDDTQADMYLAAVDMLRERGFRQYEISNFARTGRESRHNLKYWTLGEYAGFGPGAHSDFGGVRYAYEKDLEGYIRGVKDHTPMLSENDRIPDLDRDTEWVMLGLRTVQGLDPADFQRRFRRRFDCFLPFLAQCQKAGYAVEEAGRWHLTPRGFLVSNQIIGGMLDALAEEKRRRAEATARGDFRVKLD